MSGITTYFDFYKYRKIRGEFYKGVKFRHPFEFFNFAVLLHHFYTTFTLNFASFAEAAEAIFLIFTLSPPLKGGKCEIQNRPGGAVSIHTEATASNTHKKDKQHERDRQHENTA
jgi:hypothetical protein